VTGAAASWSRRNAKCLTKIDLPKRGSNRKSMSSSSQVICIAAILLYCARPGPVFAADDDNTGLAPSQSTLDEIVVTAQRREERLQDVPISVSVFSALEIERWQIDDLNTLQYAAPNLTMTPFPGPMSVSIAMRGQSEPDLFPTLDPAVGVYLDGVYIARIGGANLRLADMERVEVLRGPQGTLFGRNTTGGAINLVPRKPEAGFGGAVTVGGGNYDRRDLEATVNIPSAAGTYATRLTASHTGHSGYGRNIQLGRDLNEEDTDFLRAQLRLMPADRWDLNLSFDFTRMDAGRNLLTMLAVFPPLTTVPAAAGNPDDRLEDYQDPTARSVHANRIGISEAEARGVSGTLTLNFERFSAKAISAFRDLDSGDHDADLDGTPYDLFTVLQREERQRQVSHEVQVYGDALRDRLEWIGGLHYFDESTTFAQRIGGVAPTTLISIENVLRGTVNNDSVAAFAEITYAITPTLQATAGVRYNQDGRQLTSRNARGIAGADICTLDVLFRDESDICQATLPERTFSYVPWTLSIDFKPADDALLYARLSRGHRAGGYNMRGTTETDLGTFEPERVTAYEIGGRAALADNRLWFSVALYRSLFDDIQLRQQVPIPGSELTLRLTQNGGEARIDGGELEVTALLGSFRLAGALGITDAKYTKLDPLVDGVTPDSNFLQTPDATFFISADRPIRVGFGEINLHADYSWRDDTAFAYDRQSLARQDAYGLFNAMITARFDKRNFELALWARNLADQRYLVRAVDIGTLVTSIPGDPRTFGASLRYRFGAPGQLP
jgi:iron complex outermembrane receptor protein